MESTPPAKQPAPGPLEEVQAFVNTRDVERGTDELAGVDPATAWLGSRGAELDGPLPEAERARLVEVREALRDVLETHHGLPADEAAGRRLDRLLGEVQLRARLTPEGATLVPGGRGAEAYLARLAIAVIEATVAGTWQRLKVCRLGTCRWAFYDHTKNGSGAWCSMRACGSRAKARAYRARQAAGGAPLPAER